MKPQWLSVSKVLNVVADLNCDNWGNERNEGMTKTQAQVVAESAQHCALYHLHFESKTFTNVKLYFQYFYDKVNIIQASALALCVCACTSGNKANKNILNLQSMLNLELTRGQMRFWQYLKFVMNVKNPAGFERFFPQKNIR